MGDTGKRKPPRVARSRIVIDAGWSVAPPRVAGGVRRSAGATAGEATLPADFLLPGVSIDLVQEVVPKIRRGAERPPLDLRLEAQPGERPILIVRHLSGALTIHRPGHEEPARRGTVGGRSVRFRVELSEAAPARRGLASEAIKLVIVKVKEALVDEAVKLGLRRSSKVAEALWWKRRKLSEGWCAIEAAANGEMRLRHVDRVDPSSGRSLLFLHGTFSHTAGSFGELLQPAVLKALHGRYEGRVFAFEHFSVSRSLEENARSLLEALPDRETVFDVVSYSRGGLVLRTLAEQPEQFGSLGRRFRLGQGVLVAVPNGGTPLATGDRWEQTVGLVANLLEWLDRVFPDNPWTMGAEFVANGLVWLAGHVSGDLPGLAAMDAGGETIPALQQGRGPVTGSYSAVAANYQPDAALWRRLLDAGIDGFFGGANDLVVPTAGAWQLDPAATDLLPAERVACFGLDGNLPPRAGGVHHLNVLAQPETARFVQRALSGAAQGLPPVELSRPPRSQRSWRGSAPAGPKVGAPPPLPRGPGSHAQVRPSGAGRDHASDPVEPGAIPSPEREGDRTLHLIVLPTADGSKTAQILAIYGSARVVAPMPLHDPEGAARQAPRKAKAARATTGEEADQVAPGTRFCRIIDHHEQIRMTLDGRADRGLPNDDELCEFGELLFDALFVGPVRRLYDVARSEQRTAPLNVVFTCAIPWVASLPWEFAFDRARGKILATEEIHFVRNVLTSVPAQRIDDRRSPLRILVVEAQPVGTVELSIDDEVERIRHKFHPLTDAGLAKIEVLADATPELLHEWVFASWLERKPYDVVHFIGHGGFDSEAERGRLLFVSSDGGTQPVDVQTLREILCGRGVQIVFLNACETAQDAGHRLNRGVAQGLVEGGLPAVVANQYKVLDPSAVAFAQHFYWALAQGASLGEAAREARIAVNYSLDGELIDWAVPVLHARDPDYRLCAPATQVAPLEPRQRRRVRGPSAARRGAKRHVVGIADLARFFPGLPSMLARLDEVQDQFAFREVEVTTPMGVWLRRKDRTYLYAERFAERLRDKPRALGVDFLGCITNSWMRNEETWDLYGWWSGDPSAPILIFSTAGLALPAEGPVAGRALANAVVDGLGSQLLEYKNVYSSHDRGPRDCPFFFNPEREVEVVSGRQRFDTRCKKRLESHLSRPIVRALDALLGAYDRELGAVMPT